MLHIVTFNLADATDFNDLIFKGNRTEQTVVRVFQNIYVICVLHKYLSMGTVTLFVFYGTQ